MPFSLPIHLCPRWPSAFPWISQGVSSVIAGARTPEQMKKNMAVASLPPLSPLIRARLEEEFGGLTESFNPDLIFR